MQGENVKNASELHSKQLRFWTQKSRKCAQSFFCKPCRQRTSKMHLNFTGNAFVFGHIYRDIASVTFFCKPCRQRTFKMHLNFTANSFVFGRKNRQNVPKTFFYQGGKAKASTMRLNSIANRFVFGHINRKSWNCAQNFYCKHCKQRTSRIHLNPTANSFTFGRENASRTFFINLARQRTSKILLNFTANRFVFGCTTREIAPRTFSVNLAGRELSKCVWTSREIPWFWDAKIEKMHPELFFYLQSENLQNAHGHHGKQLRFYTQKSWKCAQNIFVNLGLWRRITQKCIWTSWQTTLFWGAKIEKMPPELLYQPCKWRIPKMYLNFLCVVTWERLQSWKYIPYIFEKIFKLCFVKFFPVKEIASKMQVLIFKICVGWRPKKVPKVPFFSA